MKPTPYLPISPDELPSPAVLAANPQTPVFFL